VRRVLCVLFLAVLAAPLCAAAKITIINANAAGVGFNDPTPATPIGGNRGTTLGQQRLLAFQKAADLWGALLDSEAEIRVKATFEPLDCTATMGTLGAAGPTTAIADFPNAPEPGTWYAVALASRLAGFDLLNSTPPSTIGAEIEARFNSNVGNSDCLATSHWYYGLDNQHGTDIDLVSVLLHEFAHGLGFLTFVDPATGAEFEGKPDIFEKHTRDDSLGKTWDALTAAEREASAIRTGELVWDSPRVDAAVPSTLSGTPTLTVEPPSTIAGEYDVGTADFGPALTTAGVLGELAAATDPSDAAGSATTDACSSLDDAAAVAGRIALVDRGTCTFVVKADNVQAAGAIGLVVANNVADPTALLMAGDDASVTIPAVSVTQADGATLRASLAAGLSVTLRLDPTRLAGADSANRLRLYAPNPLEDGSSVSHWDTSAYPHLLMQPNLAGDLPHEVDLTLPMLQDIGWEAAPTSTPPAGGPRGDVTRESGEPAPRVVPRRP
jgi:PA domain